MGLLVCVCVCSCMGSGVSYEKTCTLEAYIVGYEQSYGMKMKSCYQVYLAQTLVSLVIDHFVLNWEESCMHGTRHSR